MVRIRGSYALAMMFKDYPEEIYVARKDSPMILGVEMVRILYCIRCSGYFEIYKKCLLYWKSGDGRVAKGELHSIIWTVKKSRKIEDGRLGCRGSRKSRF